MGAGTSAEAAGPGKRAAPASSPANSTLPSLSHPRPCGCGQLLPSQARKAGLCRRVGVSCHLPLSSPPPPGRPENKAPPSSRVDFFIKVINLNKSSEQFYPVDTQFRMHKNTGEGGRRAKKGRVGNLFWSPHGADGREPEGLQANPTFFFF